MKTTETVLKALRYIASRNGITSGELAGEMWPDSPRWRVSKQMGNRGACRGAGMFRPALGLLGKMAKAGLVEHDRNRSGSTSIWVLTDAGKAAIA